MASGFQFGFGTVSVLIRVRGFLKNLDRFFCFSVWFGFGFSDIEKVNVKLY